MRAYFQDEAGCMHSFEVPDCVMFIGIGAECPECKQSGCSVSFIDWEGMRWKSGAGAGKGYVHGGPITYPYVTADRHGVHLQESRHEYRTIREDEMTIHAEVVP